MKFLIIIILIGLGNLVNGQSRPKYKNHFDNCEKTQLENFDGILGSAKFNQDSSNIELTLINSTKRTTYLYSGLFKDWMLEQPYTHKVDTKKELLILSLTPTFGYFNHINKVENFSLMAHYNWYKFIVIQPNEIIKISLKHHFYKSYNESFCWAIPYNDPYKYESTLELPFIEQREISFKGLDVELSLYNSINFVYQTGQESDYHKDRLAYKTIRIKVK